MRKTLLVILTLLVAFNAHAVIGKGVPKSTVNLRQQNRIIDLVNSTCGEEYVQGLWFFDGDRITTTIPDSKTVDVGSKYPPAYSTTYVKATNEGATEKSWCATDPSRPLTGIITSNAWVGLPANQRFHIDLGSAKVIKKIYYENFHASGIETDVGVQNFTFWGSNTAASFADLVYANDAGWTQLTTSPTAFDEHAAADAADPKYITVTNFTPYRYYALKCADNYGDIAIMGVRRIELQANSPAHNMTLGGAASTLSPSYSRFCPNLTMANAAATSWSVADSNDFTFGDGVTDSPMSVIALINPTAMGANTGIVTKRTGANQREWNFQFLVGVGKLAFGVFNNLNSGVYRFKYYNTALTADVGSWHCYTATYDGRGGDGGAGDVTTAGITIYRDGSDTGSADVLNAGSYTAMTGGTGTVNSWANIYGTYKYGVVIIISKELTPTEVATLSNALLIYAGAL